MEAAGAVFLPAEGCRCYGTELYDVGTDGTYWSSTPNGEYYAYVMYFLLNHVDCDEYFYRGIGFSVRLVQDY